jgi:hypothetical protein
MRVNQMSRHRRKMSPSAIKKLISEGRGQGNGPNYQPWIRVQEFISKGQRNRVLGWKTGRQHDYFSLLELYYHYILDWSPAVTDIQEQYPLLTCNSKLPLEETILIARQCGIRHPTDSETKEPVPLTTDFVITVQQSIGVIRVARTVKQASELSKKRVIEKFEIERRFWQGRGIGWGIVTELEIDKILAQNIDWIHPYKSLSALQPLTNQAVQRIAKTLSQMLSEETSPLNDSALSCDDRLGLESGTSLAVVRHLIANKQWQVDLTQPIHPGKSLNLADVSIHQLNKKASNQ